MPLLYGQPGTDATAGPSLPELTPSYTLSVCTTWFSTTPEGCISYFDTRMAIELGAGCDRAPSEKHVRRADASGLNNDGAWPSGKARDFGPRIRRFESFRPSHFREAVGDR